LFPFFTNSQSTSIFYSEENPNNATLLEFSLSLKVKTR
jgi:hypothetical protein